MNSVHYIGLDIHKKIIAFCIKAANGNLVARGAIPATLKMLRSMDKRSTLNDEPQPWRRHCLLGGFMIFLNLMHLKQGWRTRRC
jgi:hypothetical protein